MTKETAVLREVEVCLSHHGIYVIPRDYRPSNERNWSIWSAIDPKLYAGVVYRNNTGAAKFGRAFVRFGVSGLPDFSGWSFASGQRLSIEVKAEKGKLTPDQAAHLSLALKTGVLAGCVRSYAEMADLLKTWGIGRRS